MEQSLGVNRPLSLPSLYASDGAGEDEEHLVHPVAGPAPVSTLWAPLIPTLGEPCARKGAASPGLSAPSHRLCLKFDLAPSSEPHSARSVIAARSSCERGAQLLPSSKSGPQSATSP